MSMPVDLNELNAAIDAQLHTVSELIDPYVALRLTSRDRVRVLSSII